MNRHDRRAMGRLAEELEGRRLPPVVVPVDDLLAAQRAFETAATNSLIRISLRVAVLETMLEIAGVFPDEPALRQQAINQLRKDGVSIPEDDTAILPEPLPLGPDPG